MFGVDSLELFIVAIAALIFIGPKDLPVAMRTVGRWVGKVRGHARHFTAGIENMMREAELEEMEKKWREENERIMREHPVALPYPGADLSTPANARAQPLEGSADAKPDDWIPASAGIPGDEPQLPLGAPDNSHRPLP
jgi:sec-independent protein translocase protein TatB